MNANAETAASASYNIAYNSLERRFFGRGTADAARKIAFEQEENERKTAELSPAAYSLGNYRGGMGLDPKYRTGVDEDGYYMSCEDYKRCFSDGMGYSPSVEIKRIENKVAVYLKNKYGDKRIDRTRVPIERLAEPYTHNTDRSVKVSPSQCLAPVTNKFAPPQTIVPIKDRRFRTLPVGAMAIALLFAVLLALPVTLSVMKKERSDAVIAAEARLDEMEDKVASLENSLSVKDDLNEIRRIAVDEYGMISMDLSTTHYLALGGKDRIEAFSEERGNTGMMALLSALGISRGE